MASLAGVRILDLSRLLPGPACSWYLSGMGASVDRVEPSGAGDPTRAVRPSVDGHSAFYSALNAGDRSIAVDLRHPSTSPLLRRLLREYDVLIDGFRPGVLEAMGLGPHVLHADQPGLIIARLSGYGQTGPWAQRPGHDLNYQGLAGALVYGGGERAGPAVPGAQLADMSGALVAAMGVCAALFDRHRTGEGTVLDISLTEAAMSTMAPHIAVATAKGAPVVPGREMLTGAMPTYRNVRCSDGKWLAVGGLEPRFQAVLAEEIGSLDPESMDAAFGQRPRDEWVERLPGACVSPILDPSELAQHEQHRSRGAVMTSGPVSYVRQPLRQGSAQTGPVARLGEHTDAILLDAGVGKPEIDSLRAEGVVS
ncbi:MAG: CaiB/BaiF CoA transferase family protein [Myxococcota bacterium]